MAKQRNNPRGGRMLFTDFDASEKGRPIPSGGDLRPRASSSSPTFFQSPLPTLEDLASTLDLDFEDDWADDSGPPARPSPPGETERAPEHAPPRSTAPESGRAADGAPTWEQFTRSFLTAVRKGATPSPEPPFGTEADRDPEPDGGDAIWEMRVDDDSAEMDILSALEHNEWDGHRDVSPSDRENWRGARLGVPPPPATPYGGIERVDEWYVPPEAADREVAPDPDWYAPPEGSMTTILPADREAPARERPDGTDTTGSGRFHLDLFADLDLDALWEEREQRSAAFLPPSTRAPRAHGETATLSKAESEKIRRRLDGSGPDAAVNEFPASTSPRQRTESGEAAGRTRIIPNSPTGGFDAHDNAMTVLPDKEAVDRRLSDAPPETADRKQKRTPPPKAGKKPGKAKPSRPTDGKELAFLEDDYLPDSSRDEAGDEAEKKARRRSGRSPASLEELDIEDLLPSEDGELDGERRGTVAGQREGTESETVHVDYGGEGRDVPSGAGRDGLSDDFFDSLGIDLDEESVHRDVTAPVIGNDSISPIRKRDPRKTVDSASRPESAAATGDVAAPEVADDFFDLESDAAPEKTPGKKRSVAPSSGDEGGDGIDLDFSDIDLDGPDVAAAGGAPEERETVDELDTLDALGDAFKSPDDGGGEGGNGEPGADAGDESSEPVALDPMDVFANMADMDFSDEVLDDDVKELLDEDAEADNREAEENAEAQDAPVEEAPLPPGFKGRVVGRLRSLRRLLDPRTFVKRAKATIAWRENWWFYCDLLAALITSASLAVLVSYYLWYR